jgi:phenylalanyl-tRNA synthetase beta chain
VPQSTLSFARTLEGLEPRPTAEELTGLLFRYSKAEAKRIEGDELVVEVTPDRLDLLSEGGLRWHVEGLLDRARGLPPRGEPPTEGRAPTIEVDASVDPLRPHLAAVLLLAPPHHPLDAGTHAELVRYQELLHATLGLDRASASLGFYAAERFRPPLRYHLRPIRGLSFIPLGTPKEVPAERFFSEHPMAARYERLGRAGDDCLVLEDAEGVVLSLPPILNAAPAGEVRVGDRSILLESTGRRAARVEDALSLLEVPLLARGWRPVPVAVEHPGRVDPGTRYIVPRPAVLARSTLRATGGVELSDEDVVRELGRARLSARAGEAGWVVEVPPWRPDLHGEVDLAEEVLLTRGLSADERRLPPSRTRGRRLPEAPLRRGMRDRLLGLGFVPLFNPVLVPERLVERIGRPAIALANPVSRELSRIRESILLSLAGSLERNVRFGYPQRLSEVGPVVRPDPGAESGSRTDHHAGFVVAAEGAGFAEAAAIVDYLLRRVQVAGVREPAELPGTIPGRAARLRLAGEVVAEVGELHPALLTELGVPVPVAWGEVDLSALGPLLAGPRA